MKKLRKVNTKKRKEAMKEATARLERQAAFFLSLPEECCVCQHPFERNQETVKTWNVTVYEEKNTIRLTCPTCWGKVEQLVKEQENV